ncbi:hypothetical protein SADO_14599 [Salinisphaera dokdonensis CL-ES53]|uniref:Uncharacterized protein n=1 Tax=Salinisphaera dokdonensis CL-ES53 TaxID=1304272 RepID=A0ABV2B4Z4_9GAMM
MESVFDVTFDLESDSVDKTCVAGESPDRFDDRIKMIIRYGIKECGYSNLRWGTTSSVANPNRHISRRHPSSAPKGRASWI